MLGQGQQVGAVQRGNLSVHMSRRNQRLRQQKLQSLLQQRPLLSGSRRQGRYLPSKRELQLRMRLWNSRLRWQRMYSLLHRSQQLRIRQGLREFPVCRGLHE